MLQRPGQALAWDAENHLAQVQWGGKSEWYTYDESGVRVSKAEGTSDGQVSSNTWYLFPHYEVKQTGTNAPVVTKYYYFGGMLIAKAEGGVLTYLHTDQLGSVVLETDKDGAVVNDQRYFAYGRRLDTGGDTSGERDFTGQKADATGLLYYNARYYDPQIGQFLSPDTVVPDPTQFLDYNRYLYARGNPLKYNDPSGHCIFGLDTMICIAIGAAAAGGIAGAAVDVAKQLWVDGREFNNLDAGEVVGSAVTGGVGGVVVAVVPPSAGWLSALGAGALGGAVGGQAGTLARATYDKYWGGKADSEIFDLAMNNGFLDPATVSIDAASGLVGGAVGQVGSKILGGIFPDVASPIGMTILRDPIPMIRWEQSIDEPGQWVFRSEGRTVVMQADITTRLIRALAQGSIEEAQAILEESVSQGTTEILDDH